jgi:rRNA biogenesis protein RRP5
MVAHKRSLEDDSSVQKPKKNKFSNVAGKNSHSATTTEEVDFPRGGGTSFTPLEVKTIRAEAVKEANEELFEVCFIKNLLCIRQILQVLQAEPRKFKKRKRKSELQTSGGSNAPEMVDRIRIEHLNYKVCS